MKYKCFIIDDEPLAVEVIENHLSKLEHFEVSGAFTNPIKAFTTIKNSYIDLLFLDIEMPDFNGLNFIKSLKTRPEIIITTAYREFAVEGFELSILDITQFRHNLSHSPFYLEVHPEQARNATLDYRHAIIVPL